MPVWLTSTVDTKAQVSFLARHGLYMLSHIIVGRIKHCCVLPLRKDGWKLAPGFSWTLSYCILPLLIIFWRWSWGFLAPHPSLHLPIILPDSSSVDSCLSKILERQVLVRRKDCFIQEAGRMWTHGQESVLKIGHLTYNQPSVSKTYIIVLYL